jgi:hypothetical protein
VLVVGCCWPGCGASARLSGIATTS